MDKDYLDQDQKHQYNKLFYRYSQQFKCPKIDRSCSDKVWAAFCLVALLWLVFLPVYLTVVQTHSLPYVLNHDFRGDICGVTQKFRPYVKEISQIGTNICVQFCQATKQCLYQPDGMNIYSDWCFDVQPSQPLNGRCQEQNPSLTSALQEISKTHNILQLCLLFSIIMSCTTIMLVTMFSILQSIWYLNIISSVILLVIGGWLITDKKPHTIIIFSIIIALTVIDCVRSIVSRKQHNVSNSICNQIVRDVRCKIQMCTNLILNIVMRGALCLLQLQTLGVSMAKLVVKEQNKFPNGYVKQYEIDNIYYILPLVYVPVFLLMMQYLRNLQELCVAAFCQAEYFNGRTHNIMALKIVVKQCGFLMKYTILKAFVDIFNQFYGFVRWCHNIPVLRYVVRAVYSSILQQYEYTTKYFHEYCLNQRVFQAETLLQGGIISYYLVKRHQIVQMKPSGTILISMVSWLFLSVYLYSQQQPDSIKYIGMHSIVVFLSLCYGMMIADGAVEGVQHVVRTILYCAVANKEMRYIQRKYQADIEKIMEQHQTVTNKVKNILDMDSETKEVKDIPVENIEMEATEQRIEEKKEEPVEIPTQLAPVEDNVLTFRYKVREEKKQIKKRTRQPIRTDLILGWN